jgi:Domain of unknown function (DUF5666)
MMAWKICLKFAICYCTALLGFAFSVFGTAAAASLPARPHQTPAPAAAARPVGTVKSISPNTLILTTDAGSDVTVQLQDGAKLVRVAPGQKDLKDATPIQLSDLQPGDRIIVRGKFADDAKTVLATGIIAMSKSDIATKQAHDREEWQRHGVGGLVSSIDPGANTVTITTPAAGENKSVLVHLTSSTILRRYAPDSIKFDDAKPAPLDQIKSGDQLRARGARNADATELTADEIVSGSFRNLSGVISAIDAAAGTLTLQDLATKKLFTVKVTPASQLRKLPAPVAQRIAARMKGAPAAAPAPTAAGGTPASPQAARPADASGAAPSNPGGQGAPGAARAAGAGDLQQAILRMPAATLSDLQKGDAVMIVATAGTVTGGVTAITLLAGVEPILQASPQGGASSLLSPWSLSGAPGGDAGP